MPRLRRQAPPPAASKPPPPHNEREHPGDPGPGGTFRVPQGAGLGFEPDPDVLEQYRVAPEPMTFTFEFRPFTGDGAVPDSRY